MKCLVLFLVVLVFVVSLEASPVKVQSKQNNEQIQAVKVVGAPAGKGKKADKTKAKTTLAPTGDDIETTEAHEAKHEEKETKSEEPDPLADPSGIHGIK